MPLLDNVWMNMSDEWIFQIGLALISALVSATFGYFLGTRSQKKQGLREYIIETVKDRYPPLVSEMKRNTKRLDDFRGNPFVSFSFPELEQIFDKGLDEFIEKHHKDLFQIISLFHKRIYPKFKQLQNQSVESRERIFEIWEQSLLESGLETKSRLIAEDLVKTINPFNTIPLFLGEKHEGFTFEPTEKNHACTRCQLCAYCQTKF
jgi:hypothetical protein